MYFFYDILTVVLVIVLKIKNIVSSIIIYLSNLKSFYWIFVSILLNSETMSMNISLLYSVFCLEYKGDFFCDFLNVLLERALKIKASLQVLSVSHQILNKKD